MAVHIVMLNVGLGFVREVREMDNLPADTPRQAGSDQENAWIQDILEQHGGRALTLALCITG